MAAVAGRTSYHSMRLPAGLVADLMEAPSLEDVWAVTLAAAPLVVGIESVRVAQLTMSPTVGYRVLQQNPEAPDISSPMMRSPMSHPIIANYVSTRFKDWVSLGDLLPGRLWLEHPLYRDVYAPAGIRAQISCAVADSGPTMVSLSVSRGGRDFSPRERDRLREYRRVVAAGYRRVSEQEAARRALQYVEHAFVGSALAGLFSPDDGSIRYASSALVAWSEQHPGVTEALTNLVRSGRREGQVHDGDLGVRVSATPTREGVVVLVHDLRPTGWSAPHQLTARETQVLAALADGLTAHAIAHRLGASEATIRKHLEHIYAKLGVGDRLAAVTLARDELLVPPASGNGHAAGQ